MALHCLSDKAAWNTVATPLKDSFLILKQAFGTCTRSLHEMRVCLSDPLRLHNLMRWGVVVDWQSVQSFDNIIPLVSATFCHTAVILSAASRVSSKSTKQYLILPHFLINEVLCHFFKQTNIVSPVCHLLCFGAVGALCLNRLLQEGQAQSKRYAKIKRIPMMRTMLKQVWD